MPQIHHAVYGANICYAAAISRCPALIATIDADPPAWMSVGSMGTGLVMVGAGLLGAVGREGQPGAG